jgi:hypothetical protein
MNDKNDPIDLMQSLFECTDDEIKDKMDHISKNIMTNFKFIVNGVKFELTEIEFYILSDKHKDESIYKNELQKLPKVMYIHQSGFDLTFGDFENYGAILIRGIKIYDIQNNKSEFVAGPWKCLQRVQELMGIYLIKNRNENFSANYNFIFIKNTKSCDCCVVDDERVGLRSDKKYANEKYRYVRSDYVEAKKDLFWKNSRHNLKRIEILKKKIAITKSNTKEIQT